MIRSSTDVKFVIFFVAVGLPLILAPTAFAATGDISNVENFIRSIIKVVAGLAGLVPTGFFVAGGFLEVRDNKITVLTSAAEAPEQIDVERAQQAKERAEERLKKHPDDLDVYRAEMALNRAIRRIEVANQNSPKKS